MEVVHKVCKSDSDMPLISCAIEHTWQPSGRGCVRRVAAHDREGKPGQATGHTVFCPPQCLMARGHHHDLRKVPTGCLQPEADGRRLIRYILALSS